MRVWGSWGWRFSFKCNGGLGFRIGCVSQGLWVVVGSKLSRMVRERLRLDISGILTPKKNLTKKCAVHHGKGFATSSSHRRYAKTPVE